MIQVRVKMNKLIVHIVGLRNIAQQIARKKPDHERAGVLCAWKISSMRNPSLDPNVSFRPVVHVCGKYIYIYTHMSSMPQASDKKAPILRRVREYYKL